MLQSQTMLEKSTSFYIIVQRAKRVFHALWWRTRSRAPGRAAVRRPEGRSAPVSTFRPREQGRRSGRRLEGGGANVKGLGWRFVSTYFLNPKLIFVQRAGKPWCPVSKHLTWLCPGHARLLSRKKAAKQCGWCNITNTFIFCFLPDWTFSV